MKKVSILFIATLAMISCGNTYTAKNVTLNDVNDSMNYALGVVNGAQIKMMHLQGDSSKATISAFIDAMQRGYDGKVEELSEAASAGKNIGQAVKASEKNGLADNKAWALNEQMFFQGMVNALYEDTTVMTNDIARDYFQSAYQMMGEPNDSIEPAGCTKKAKCMDKAKTVTLANIEDSLNYAFGFLNGNEIRMYILANDSDGSMIQEFVTYVNKGLKSKDSNPQLINMGEQIGKTIKEQETQGLIGEPSLATDFELIKQGFINGMYGKTFAFTGEEAGQYIQNTMNNIKYGNVKAEGEKYLAQNALKEGVTTTESGLQYEVITMGNGPKPTAESTVKVHYHGTLIDGTVFDSSVERGEPISFPLNGVIKGWTEGLQLMPVGSKFKFYIPQELAYGANNMGQIPPYSTLIFEVELLGIE